MNRKTERKEVMLVIRMVVASVILLGLMYYANASGLFLK